MRVSRGQTASAVCVLWLSLLPAGARVPVPVALSAPPVDRGPLSVRLPDALPASESRVGWDTISGEVEHGGTTIRYHLFVNPRYGGLYQITQYRMWKSEGSRAETEKVLWNETPGSRVPLRMYELVDGAWQDIAVGTPAYNREIIHVIRVYDLHRQARGHAAGYGR